MNPRFDLFRIKTPAKWVGTAESLGDLEKLIRADSGGASQDDYAVVRSGYGVTEVLTKAGSERS